jgi:hypothetical protein
MATVYRARISQPSTLQPLHELDGRMCIAVDNGPDDVRLYFTDGPVHSMQAKRLWITRIRLSSAG